MAESTSLLKMRRRNPSAGSNPALSATPSTTYGILTKFLSKRARVRAAHGKSRKALANKDQSPLKGWEYPAGSAIRIREVINRSDGKDFGVSYRVSIPAKYAGKRVLKQFADTEAAEAWAKEQYDGFVANGQAHFELTATEYDEAIKALVVLRETGLSLLEAANFTKDHYKPADKAITVEAAVEKLLAEKAAENLRPRSIRDLRNRLRPFVESFGDKPVHTVKSYQIQHWLDELKGLSAESVDGFSARSLKNYIVTLKTFFNFTISKGYRAKGDNPVEGITPPKIDWVVPPILTIEETKRLLKTAQDFREGALLPLVVLGLFAGIRTNELYQLSWSNIDLEEGLVTIDATIAKKRRLRVIELTPNALAWLNACPVKEGKIAIHHAELKMAELVKLAGFENWRKDKSNAMRHSFGTYHYALHQNSALTSAALGHRANDQVLFDSYRSLARKKDGDAYFRICP